MAIHGEQVPTFSSWAIKYSIWLIKENWVIKPILDEEKHVLTNIQWMIVEKVENIFKSPWVVIVHVDADRYSEIDAWVANVSENSRIRSQQIIDYLYNSHEKSA